MTTARNAPGGAGTQTAGLAFGGNPGPAPTNATEEYTGVFNATRTLTTS